MGEGPDLDRCAGVLVGLATGDALGAGYEFRRPPVGPAEMIGGGLGPWEPGEWTDDTQMALCIAEEAATGKLDPLAVAGRFLGWYRGHPKDVGIQTSAVLGASQTPADVRSRAEERFERYPRNSAGNGSLMRTAPVALSALGDDDRLVSLATEVSRLTHGDPLAMEACVLWCIAIDRAVRQGRLDGVYDGIGLLPAERQDFWRARVAEAHEGPPGRFAPNGFVVTAFQAALSAIWHTPVPKDQPCRHFADALQVAVRIGDDTDTVAAIAGSVLGARWGATAVPVAWRVRLHGWPGYRGADLVRLAVMASTAGVADGAGWPAADDLTSYYRQHWPAAPVAEPLEDDSGVVVANIFGASATAADVMVSLCRVGRDVPVAVERVEVALLDSDDPAANPNLDFVLSNLAAGIAAWRDQGKSVLIHCVQAERRTPAVAAAYLAHRLGVSGAEAWARVHRQLPASRPNSAFATALDRLWPQEPG
jgi:ADP-ribosylglycohydrolase